MGLNKQQMKQIIEWLGDYAYLLQIEDFEDEKWGHGPFNANPAEVLDFCDKLEEYDGEDVTMYGEEIIYVTQQEWDTLKAFVEDISIFVAEDGGSAMVCDKNSLYDSCQRDELPIRIDDLLINEWMGDDDLEGILFVIGDVKENDSDD